MSRQPIQRIVPFIQTRAALPSDGLTLEGYASVFGEVARVFDLWEGEYDEDFAKGCFTKTLRERTPYLMYQHGRHPLFGPLPIGAFSSLGEDNHGLNVAARLHDNWLVVPVRDAIASGSVDGMSIMFEPVLDRIDNSGDIKKITRVEVKLLELGPVVFQAFMGTEVNVRSLNDMRLLKNELERPVERERIVVALATTSQPATLELATTSAAGSEATVSEIAGEAPETQATPEENGAGETPDERAVPASVLALRAQHEHRRYAPAGVLAS